MSIRYSALNSRLLLPPRTRSVPGSRGPTVGDQIRACCIADEYSFSKIGNSTVLANGAMARQPRGSRSTYGGLRGMYDIVSREDRRNWCRRRCRIVERHGVPGAARREIGWSTVL